MIFILPICLYLPILFVFFQKLWMYSFLYPFLVIVLAVSESSKEYLIFLGCLTVFFNFKENGMLNSITYSLIIGFCFFEILRQYLSEQVYELDFILMLSSFLFIGVSSALSKMLNQELSKKTENEYLSDLYMGLKGKGLSHLKKRAVFLLESIFMGAYLGGKKTEGYIEFPIEKWSNETFFAAILEKLNRDKQDDMSVDSELSYLCFKIFDEAKIFETFKEIETFYRQQLRDQQGVFAEYQINFLQHKVDSVYYTKDKEFLEPYETIQLSKLSQLFLRTAIIGFDNLKLFWKNVALKFDEADMEYLLLKVIESKIQMKQLLFEMNRKYKAET